jgi:dolichol-phosphate mannosyltransferase
MIAALPQILRSERLIQFIKFCVVGGSGFLIDMAVLCLLADPRFLALNVTFSKLCAAETALASNFTWNELWTFRAPVAGSARRRGIVRRFLTFNAICGIGIGLAALLLNLFYFGLKWNLYVSNIAAIILVTFWNFGLNARFNWKIGK